MICSTLNNKLLLPPSTRPVFRSDGPIERRSNPRMLYSPPRNNFSKIGNSRSLDRLRMYSSCPRKPIDMRLFSLKNDTASIDGFKYLVLPPSPARSDDKTSRLPVVGKIGWSTELYCNVGVTLLMMRSPD